MNNVRRVKSERPRNKNGEFEKNPINIEGMFESKSVKRIESIKFRDPETQSINNRYGRLPPVENKKKRFLDFNNDKKVVKKKSANEVLLSQEGVRRKQSEMTDKKSDLYISNKIII